MTRIKIKMPMEIGKKMKTKTKTTKATLALAIVASALALMLLGSAQAKEVPASAVARLKVPADARIVSPATPKGRSGRVETEACVANKPAAAVAEDTRAALVPEWGPIEVIPNRTMPGRFVLVGEKDGLGVSAVVSSPSSSSRSRGPCTQGEVHVAVGVLALPERDPNAKPDSGRVVGPPGVRSARTSRPPMVLAPASE